MKNQDSERLPHVVERIDPSYGQVLRYGRGWDDIVAELHEDLLGVDPDVKYLQVKEKFGVLRVYVDDRGWPAEKTNEAERLIRASERLSMHTCMLCGQPGSQVTIRGWTDTFCQRHQQEKREREGYFADGLSIEEREETLRPPQ